MTSSTKNTVSEICTALMLLLLVYTGTVKLFDFPAFQMVLSTSPLIGQHAITVARLLPLLELLIAVILFIPRTRLSGLAASTILMAVFTVYVAYMLLFEPKLPCSCGGVIAAMGWPEHLLFNLFFTGIGLLGWWTRASRFDKTGPIADVAAATC
ncbi:MauE/DoxX family redox-associated membrane protein [Flaviaesturariibacter amylovorans]|uniref:Methylamine utilisation protein MauE domain-containing protein n=1 Tax=Flaviaesturariibacter amylovorans TaxID=1084520 RepID=A0ABP8HIN0_9BACT